MCVRSCLHHYVPPATSAAPLHLPQVLATEKAELRQGKEAAECQLAQLQQRMQVRNAVSGPGRRWRRRCVRSGPERLVLMQRYRCQALRVPFHPAWQARETEVAAQLAAKEEEARRAAQQAAAATAAAAAAPPARAPLAPAAAPAPAAVNMDADMGVPEADEFEDAENLPNINKMTISQARGLGGGASPAGNGRRADRVLNVTISFMLHAQWQPVAAATPPALLCCHRLLGAADEGLADGARPRGRRVGAGAGAGWLHLLAQPGLCMQHAAQDTHACKLLLACGCTATHPSPCHCACFSAAEEGQEGGL